MLKFESILIFLLLTVAYKLIPEDMVYHFPFSKYESTVQFVVFVTIMRWIIAALAIQLGGYFCFAFAGIMIGKSIDFILCGNTPYFGLDWLTFNTVSITVFCAYEFIRQCKRQTSL